MKNIFKYASIIGCTFASINFAANYVDYKVKNGDTLFGIAFAHDMTANEFLKVNNISDPDKYNLKIGETLKVKEAGYNLVYDSQNKVYGLKAGEEKKSYKDYKVKNGDTLFGIAFAHGMTANEFLAINNIKDAGKYNLRVGETLKVANNEPEKNNNVSSNNEIKNNNRNNNNNIENYDKYKVQSGDTLYGIAFAHGMTASEFLKINNIDDPDKYKLYVGKTMYVKASKKENNSNNEKDSQNEIEYYTVKSGDTLYGIAFQNDINVNDFLRINNIDDPLKYKLRTGEKLKIYARANNSNAQSKTIRTYKVKNGDTLGEIALKNSMSLKDLMQLNNLKNNYVLKVGDTLKIYDNININTSSKPAQYRTLENYKVKNGDTLSEIALSRGMDLVELYSINNINDKYVLKIGDTLKVYTSPKKTAALVITDYKVQNGDTLYSIARKHKMDLRDLMQLNNIKNANEYKLYIGANLKVKTTKMLVYSFNDDSVLPESSFIWPYKGIIVSGYGVSSDKIANRGVNILGDVGDKVVASDDGIVEYVDNIRGFGTVIILKHKNGYNTSYAHLSKVNVKLGDIVKKGEYIGDIGNTGMIDRSELYFKISYQGRSVDPVKLLPKS